LATQRDTGGPHTDEFPSYPDEAVRAGLDNILQSRTFRNAPSLSRFLRYVVEQALEGKANQSKEYSIGVEVFDRGESFDPRIDTIVRVQARRLRAKLASYYVSEGLTSPIVIEIPVGEYAAVFRQSPRPDAATYPDSIDEIFSGVADDRRQTSRLGGSPLPVARTPLVGRASELGVIKRILLSGNVRLVTLIGAGGSGKTRLAVQAAKELTNDFPGGVFFVPLAYIPDPGLVAAAIAESLGVRNPSGKPVAFALREHVLLAMQAPALLVIDNFEHLLGAAPLIGELLDSSGELKILLTSREVLHLYGEHEIGVPPLPTPNLHHLPPVSELCRVPSVELFVQRATAINPRFELNQDNSRAIAGICNRLDGLPLAIELAAARLRTHTPDGLLARLDNSLELLSGGARDVPARQRTLRSTIDWSHVLLNAAEQKLFRRLSVFVGGCTLESAEAVCDVRRDLGLEVLTGVSSLLDKSLLQQMDHSVGPSRFVMLETVREYAQERLIESGESEQTRHAHAAYGLVVAEERNLPMTPAETANWMELCGAEHDNLRAALDWLIETDRGEWALRLGLSLYHFWEAREHLVEGLERLHSILGLESVTAPSGGRAHATFCAATLSAAQRDYDGAFRLFREALEEYRELEDEKGVAAMLSAIGTNRRLCGDLKAGQVWLQQALLAYQALRDRPRIAASLSNLADIADALGDCWTARKLFEEAHRIFLELGHSASVAWTFNQLGGVAFRQGEFIEARRLYTQGANMFRQLGDQRATARCNTDLGYVACELYEYEAANSLFGEALTALHGLKHTLSIARVLEGFAYLAMRETNFHRALTLAGAAAGLRSRLGSSARPDEKASLERSLAAAWMHFQPTQATAIRTAGTRIPLEEAIRYALERSPTEAVSTFIEN